MNTIRIAGVVAALAVIGIDTGHAATACDRACLTGFVDTYFNALAANNPGAVPLASNAKITTNGRLTTLDQAFWDSAERTVYRWDIVNEQLGDTGTDAVVVNADGSKTMYMLRLKVQNGKISEVDEGRGKVKVLVNMFGRDTPVELDSLQIKKI